MAAMLEQARRHGSGAAAGRRAADGFTQRVQDAVVAMMRAADAVWCLHHDVPGLLQIDSVRLCVEGELGEARLVPAGTVDSRARPARRAGARRRPQPAAARRGGAAGDRRRRWCGCRCMPRRPCSRWPAATRAGSRAPARRRWPSSARPRRRRWSGRDRSRGGRRVPGLAGARAGRRGAHRQSLRGRPRRLPCLPDRAFRAGAGPGRLGRAEPGGPARLARERGGRGHGERHSRPAPIRGAQPLPLPRAPSWGHQPGARPARPAAGQAAGAARAHAAASDDAGRGHRRGIGGSALAGARHGAVHAAVRRRAAHRRGAGAGRPARSATR